MPGLVGTDILLVDNGSKRAASTLGLRALAARLAAATGREVHPVSLQHADAVPASALYGVAAQTFSAFMRMRLQSGVRRFLVVPLLFGPSRALNAFMPRRIDRLVTEFGPFELHLADVLCPLPDGEPRLARILADHVVGAGTAPGRILLVDHGSPRREVTAVREWLAERLQAMVPSAAVSQAVMERRTGPEYDFNGPLLEQALDRLGGQGAQRIALAMLFLLPGRHAGEGGDIAEICARARARHPGLEIAVSALVGEHPLLIDILVDRLAALN